MFRAIRMFFGLYLFDGLRRRSIIHEVDPRAEMVIRALLADRR